jgi:anti-sigma factor RsiW
MQQTTSASPVLAITDADLAAYAEGRLDRARRAEIAGFLACNPDLAAKVMRETHLRERMRSAGGAAAPATGRFARTTKVVAACFTCAVAGWAVAEGLDDDGPFRDLRPTPEYVDDAVMAQRVTLMRFTMHSQPEAPLIDAQELLRTVSLRVPVLPEDWRVLDTQVYPSEEGPTVSVLMEPVPGHRLNLFAVRADTSVTSKPVLTMDGGEYAVYWELDGAAYVLTGESRSELLERASLLAGSGMM